MSPPDTVRPRLVALCGYPKAGKTTLAEFLVERYGAALVDDGAVLREAAMALYGVARAEVYTQEGKARSLEVCGKSFTHRQLCGDLGNLLEGFYGEQFMPEQTLRRLQRDTRRGFVAQVPFFVFPSVRKTQGITYRKEGGIVIGVRRPGTSAENDFDRYDESLVDHWLDNDSTMGKLIGQAIDLFEGKFGFQPRHERLAA
jgi:hypothetical protein